MELIKKILAAMFGGNRPVADDAEAAWRDYESTWAMDPPPEPRAVFMAGYQARAQKSEQRSWDGGSSEQMGHERATAP